MKSKICSLGLVLIILFCFTGCAALNNPNKNVGLVSPFDYGLGDAKTGIETYWALYNAHVAALNQKTNVNYDGIGRLEIEIPADAKSIPLTAMNDFKGLELIVKNQSKDFTLFVKNNQSKKINIDKIDIDRGDFTKYEELKYGLHILKITDDTLWVDNREGYSYGHTREDILLIKNGQAVNKTIYPYNNSESIPSCCFFNPEESVVFKNICFKRDENATHKTLLFFINGENDVFVKNVSTSTPKSDMVNDYLMRTHNSTNVTFENVNIEGTYSRKNYSGYGISLNNVWNYKAKGLICKANWGVFGNNNVNTSMLEDCVINRFDVHCYGKDFYFKNVRFEDLYNQFSSIFGDIVFDKCFFDKFEPVLYEPAYNAYTPHNILFNDCEINLTTKQNYLITTGNIKKTSNYREPIARKCLPNVVINKMKVNLPIDVKEFILFKIGANTDKDIVMEYIDRVSISGVKFVCQNNTEPITITICSNNVNTVNELFIQVKDIQKVKSNKGSNNIDKEDVVIIGMNKGNNNNRIETKNIIGFNIKD